jgi:DNA mismatch repair ATPase MutS
MKMITIWNELKSEHNLDLVLIQMGMYIRAWNEDAYKMSELFNMNIANTKKDNTGNDYTGFPSKALDKYKKQIEKVGLSYVVLTLDRFTADNGQSYFRRTVTTSSVNNLKGLTFINDKPIRKFNKNMKDKDSEFIFLNAVLNGVLAHTGEQIEKSSPWAHPQILEDIEEFMIFEKKK